MRRLPGLVLESPSIGFHRTSRRCTVYTSFAPALHYTLDSIDVEALNTLFLWFVGLALTKYRLFMANPKLLQNLEKKVSWFCNFRKTLFNQKFPGHIFFGGIGSD